jgi:hypothetical protein
VFTHHKIPIRDLLESESIRANKILALVLYKSLEKDEAR